MASDDVAVRIAEIQTMVDDSLRRSVEFLDLMKNELDFHVDPLVPKNGWFAPSTITVDAEKPERPDLPMPEIAVPGDMAAMPEFNIPFPADEVLTLPRDLTFTEQEYVSALLDDVKAWLRSGVANGGTGLDASVEADIWNRQHERDLQTYNDAVDRKISQWSSRGFTMPNDFLAAQIEELDDKFRMTDIDKSRDIAIKQAELAQTNTHYIITNSLTLEGLTLGHHKNMLNRALDAGKAIVSAGVEILNAQIKRYNASLDAYKTRAITFTELEKQKLEYHIARTNRWKSIVEAQIARVKGFTDIYQADTQVYSAELGKAEAAGRIRVAQQQMMVAQHGSNMDRLLDAAKINLQKMISQAQFKITAIMQGGQIYSHLAGSAVNAINAIVQQVETMTKT